MQETLTKIEIYKIVHKLPEARQLIEVYQTQLLGVIILKNCNCIIVNTCPCPI